jgi:hypothetical protein
MCAMAGGFGLDAIEAQRTQIQFFDKGLNDPDWMSSQI